MENAQMQTIVDLAAHSVNITEILPVSILKTFSP